MPHKTFKRIRTFKYPDGTIWESRSISNYETADEEMDAEHIELIAGEGAVLIDIRDDDGSEPDAAGGGRIQ